MDNNNVEYNEIQNTIDEMLKAYIENNYEPNDKIVNLFNKLPKKVTPVTHASSSVMKKIYNKPGNKRINTILPSFLKTTLDSILTQSIQKEHTIEPFKKNTLPIIEPIKENTPPIIEPVKENTPPIIEPSNTIPKINSEQIDINLSVEESIKDYITQNPDTKTYFQNNPVAFVNFQLVYDSKKNPGKYPNMDEIIKNFRNRTVKENLIDGIEICIANNDRKIDSFEEVLESTKDEIKEKPDIITYRHSNDDLKKDEFYKFLSEDGKDTTSLENEIKKLKIQKEYLETELQKINDIQSDNIPLKIVYDNGYCKLVQHTYTILTKDKNGHYHSEKIGGIRRKRKTHCRNTKKNRKRKTHCRNTKKI